MTAEIPKPSITEVFEHYGLRIIGRDSGGWRKSECPIPDHEDNNPSASINEDLCRWHCHTCARGGDAIDLIMERDNVGFAGAAEIAKGFSGGGDTSVRAGRGSSSLVPARKGSRPGRRAGSAPWLRF